LCDYFLLICGEICSDLFLFSNQKSFVSNKHSFFKDDDDMPQVVWWSLVFTICKSTHWPKNKWRECLKYFWHFLGHFSKKKIIFFLRNMRKCVAYQRDTGTFFLSKHTY
jgi:hypothetical protein